MLVQDETKLAEPIPEPTKTVPTGKRSWLKGIGLTFLLGLVATGLAPLPGLAVMGSLTIALLLGIGWRTAFGLPAAWVGGTQFSARKLLRLAIILTGVRLNFALIVTSGWQILGLDAALIVFGVSFIPWLARRCGIAPGLARLIGVGQAICGASAVGAVAALVPEADDDDVSLAVAICGLVGTLGVLGFVAAHTWLGWQGRFYALLSGSTLHEIAQVAAAGPVAGPNAADLSLIVKLTRVVLLAPVVLAMTGLLAWRTRRQNGATSFSWRKLPLPWFVFGFLAVGGLNSTSWFSRESAGLILQAATFLFVMSMAGMGLMVDLAVIRQKGGRALLVATAGFGLFVLVSLLLVGGLGLA